MVKVCIVIPAYKEGGRLPSFLNDLYEKTPRESGVRVTLAVVDDHSPTEHWEIERAAVDAMDNRFRSAGLPHTARIVRAPKNGGKGAAIRLGWKSSPMDVEWLGFMDADGAVPPHEVWRLLRMLARGTEYDVIAASRVRMAGRSLQRPPSRDLQGRLFAMWVEAQLGLGFHDTQCGYKLFRSGILRSVMERLQETRWNLDVELLAALKSKGARFWEEPVDWAEVSGSKVIPGLDAIIMGLGVSRIKSRWKAN